MRQRLATACTSAALLFLCATTAANATPARAGGAWPASIAQSWLCSAAPLPWLPAHACPPATASDLSYRADGHLLVSADAGQQWSTLAPQCSAIDNGYANPRIRLVAVDAGRAGHVVVGMTGGAAEGADPFDIAGCAIGPFPGDRDAPSKDCARRTIAWTADVGPQVAAVLALAGSAPLSWNESKAIAQAGSGWRFASTGALGAGAGCAVSQPIAACAVAAVVCHGRKPTSALASVEQTPDAWCPAYTQACTCQLAPGCAAPSLSSLAIDPRNGFVYATTANAGLLLSRDYGARWERSDKSERTLGTPEGWTSPDMASNRFYDSQPAAGVQLRTATRGDDLNQHPERIAALGELTLAWQPCANGATYAQPDARGQPRVRGSLTATQQVRWQTAQGKAVAGVFAADQPDDCAGTRDLPGPLVLRAAALAAAGASHAGGRVAR